MSVYFLTLWRILRTLSCSPPQYAAESVHFKFSSKYKSTHRLCDFVQFLNIITGEMCWEYRTNRNTLWKNRNIVWNQQVKKASLSFCNRWVGWTDVSDLQASLFSLPLSVLPDWLEFLELFSVLSSCCWCSGSSSSAFLRQIAANSILATGIAADWPSLYKDKHYEVSLPHIKLQ